MVKSYAMDPNVQKFEEIHRLVKENNRMLHAMRRNAFFGGIIRLLIWAVALGIPVWLFFTYLFPILESTVKTFEQIQGVGVSAQSQFEGLSDTLHDIKSGLPFTQEGQ